MVTTKKIPMEVAKRKWKVNQSISIQKKGNTNETIREKQKDKNVWDDQKTI